MPHCTFRNKPLRLHLAEILSIYNWQCRNTYQILIDASGVTDAIQMAFISPLHRPLRLGAAQT